MLNELQKKLIPEVVFMYGRPWKSTPGYINTYVSDTGEIALLNSSGVLIKAPTQQWKTTKGTYLYVRLINDDFMPVQKAAHQIVCLTYHGLAPVNGMIYEPNHKDADKHNNHPDNLEWMTRGQNVQHAFDSGICQAGLRIEAMNILTKEVTKYNSLSTMARQWGMSRHNLKSVLANHREKPYDDLWIFSVDDQSDKKLHRHQRKAVVFKDYVTGALTIAESAEKAGMLTKVKAGSIVVRLSPRNQSVNKEALLSRYVFRTIDNASDWPIYTEKEAYEAEEKYSRVKKKISFEEKSPKATLPVQLCRRKTKVP